MPEIFMGPDMMQIAQPGFDASSPNLDPDEVKFSTRFRGLAVLDEILAPTAPGNRSFNDALLSQTHFQVPLLVPAIEMPANFWGENGSDSSQCLVINPVIGVTQTFQDGSNTYDITANYWTFIVDTNRAIVYPVWNNVWGSPRWVGPVQAWCYIFRHFASDDPGEGLHITAEGGDPELRIAKAGHNPVTASEEDLYYSSAWQGLTLVQSGAVSPGGPTESVSIPNQGFRPAIFYWTNRYDRAGCVNIENNTTLTFYRNFEDDTNLSYTYQVFDIPMPAMN